MSIIFSENYDIISIYSYYILGHNYVNNQSILNMNCQKPVLEQPLSDIFVVMSVCNRAHFECVRKPLASEREAQAKVSAKMLNMGQVSKRFTVLLVNIKKKKKL